MDTGRIRRQSRISGAIGALIAIVISRILDYGDWAISTPLWIFWCVSFVLSMWALPEWYAKRKQKHHRI